jgi:hypothetical protein
MMFLIRLWFEAAVITHSRHKHSPELEDVFEHRMWKDDDFNVVIVSSSKNGNRRLFENATTNCVRSQ